MYRRLHDKTWLCMYKHDTKKTKTKWELDNFLKKCYIENIWVFRKGEERVPLFSRGLEDFFV